MLVILLLILFVPFPLFAADKKPDVTCQDKLKMVDAMAQEYDRLHGQAVREKISYKQAYEMEKAAREALQKQVTDLKAKYEPAKDEKKVE